MLFEREQIGDEQQAFLGESNIVAFRVGKPQTSKRFYEKSHFNL